MPNPQFNDSMIFVVPMKIRDFWEKCQIHGYSIQWFGDQIDSKIGSPGQSEMNDWWDYRRRTNFSSSFKNFQTKYLPFGANPTIIE